MKPKLFIDTDIIIDLFAKREPFYVYAAKLFTLIDEGKVEAFTTPVVFSNLFFLLSRFKTRDFAHASLRKLRLLLNIIYVDHKIVDLALNSNFKDFEDAMQFYSSKSNNVEFIITRNVKDFIEKDLIVLTAEEYLNRFNDIP
jgi:predicted nucleic acid-binding protein